LIAGKFVALSILHGGPASTFFAPCVIDYLFGGISGVKPRVADVPDCIIRDKIEKVSFYTTHYNYLYCF
jgi:hypothetical protein